MKNIILWILIVPAGFLCSMIVPGIYKWLVAFVITQDSFAYSFVSNYATFYLEGVSFVLPGILLAPSFKRHTSIVLTIIYLLMVSYAAYGAFEFNDGAWDYLTQGAMGLAGCASMIYFAYSEYKAENIGMTSNPKRILNPDERAELILKVSNAAYYSPEAKKIIDQRIEEAKQNRKP